MAYPKKMSIHMNPKPIDIIFQNLTYTVSYGKFNSETKTILKGVSGQFKSGELTAIMGPSGAGKSSLLNILTGFNEFGVQGCIKATNQTNSKKKNGLDCRDSCYILQDDQLCPLFTVQEIMNITADLKLGPSVSKESKQYLIEGILTTIGLTKAKETRCARLSGGQKKRLSIALELIDNPPVMFLDEPTTGLDSSSCTQTVATLRRLAKGGRTIVCTIHQPSASVFEMFDHVYVIADGLCVYQGSSYNIVPYLQTIGLHCPHYHNPADFVLEVVTGEYGHFTSQMVAIANDPCWRAVTASTKAAVTLVDNCCEEIKEGNGIQRFSELFSAPSEFYRFFILFQRCAVKLYRDWTVSHLKVVLHFLVGIFIGILYADCGTDASKSIYNVGFLIVSLVYLSYTSLMPAILKFPNELNVIRKEQFNNWYKLKTYYLAFLAVNIPMQMLFTTIYAVFAYYLSSQISEYWRFLKFLLVCMLTTLINEGFGLFLGTSLSPVNGVFMGAVLICFFILFAGYVVFFAHMPRLLYYVSYSSYFRYAFEAMVQSVYGNGRGILKCPKEETYCHYRYPQKIFEELSMDETRYVNDVLMLFFFLVMFFVMSFFSLRHNIRKN